jgi:hypothetical protein
MESTNNIAAKILNYLEHTKDLDITGTSVNIEEEPSKSSPDNRRPLTCASLEVMDEGGRGDTYRRRWKITVQMLEDTRSDDE